MDMPLCLLALLVVPLTFVDTNVVYELRMHSLLVRDNTCARSPCRFTGNLWIIGLHHELILVDFMFSANNSQPYQFADSKSHFRVRGQFEKGYKRKRHKYSLLAYIRMSPDRLGYGAVASGQHIHDEQPLEVYQEDAINIFVQFKLRKITLWVLVKAYCDDGFNGETCQKPCDLPFGLKSRSVRCNATTLRCRKGWTGLDCSLRDPCDTLEGVSVCQNDAECIPTYTEGLAPGSMSTFRCNCRPGWTGDLCSLPIMEECLLPDGRMSWQTEIGYRYVFTGFCTAIQQDKNSNHRYILWRTNQQADEEFRKDPLSADKDTFYPYGLFIRSLMAYSPPKTSTKKDNKSDIPSKETDADKDVLGDDFGNKLNRSRDEEFEIAVNMWRQPFSHARMRRSAGADFAAEQHNAFPDTEMKTWRLLTRMQPCPTSDELTTTTRTPCFEQQSFNTDILPRCPIEAKRESSLKQTMKDCQWRILPTSVVQLSNCWKYHYAFYCYNGPCLLMTGHGHSAFNTTGLYVKWNQAISQALPDLINWHVSLSFKKLILPDKVKVTAISLHCTVNRGPLTQADLLNSFLQFSLDEWQQLLPGSTYTGS